MEITGVAIIVAIVALCLGGFAKGISGMGLPVIATPNLTLLYDLQTAIALVVPATLVMDVIFLYRIPKNWGMIKHAIVLIIFGMLGTVLGTFLLVHINQLILSGVLSILIFAYIVTSLFSLLPPLKQRTWLDATVGLAGGIFQGSAGACGPVISMYLLQIPISRQDFLFLINSFFLFIDIIQLVTIYQLGFYAEDTKIYALIALIPALFGLVVAFRLQNRISNQLFRLSVFVIMGISAVMLFVKSLQFF